MREEEEEDSMVHCLPLHIITLLSATSTDTWWMLSQSAPSPSSPLLLPRSVSKNWLSNHVGMSQGPARLGRAWVWAGAGRLAQPWTAEVTRVSPAASRSRRAAPPKTSRGGVPGRISGFPSGLAL